MSWVLRILMLAMILLWLAFVILRLVAGLGPDWFIVFVGMTIPSMIVSLRDDHIQRKKPQ